MTSRTRRDGDLSRHLPRMLAVLRRTIRQLERAEKEAWAAQLAEQGRTGDLRRLEEGVARLGAMCEAFTRHVEASKDSRA